MGNENVKEEVQENKKKIEEDKSDEDLDEVYDKVISKPFTYVSQKESNKMRSYDVIIKNIPQQYICKESERFKKLYRVKKNFIFGNNLIYEVRVLEKKINGQQYIGKYIRKEDIEKIGLENYLEILKSEIRGFSRISHPNTERLLKIYIYKERDSFTIIQVTSFSSNYSLLDDMNYRISKKEKYEEYEIKYVAQILTSISLSLRANSLVHRNISPDNIFFFKKRTLKGLVLKNYGFSVEIDKNGNCNGVYGPLWYLAPEIFKGLRYDYKSDIWSIGIIIYMMTTLENPFVNCEKSIEIIKTIKEKDFILSAEQLINRGVSPELAELIHSLLDENPITRISNERIFDLEFFKKDIGRLIPSYNILYNFIDYKRYLSEELRIILNETEAGELFHLLIYHIINKVSYFLLDNEDILLANEIYNFLDDNMNGSLTFQEIEVRLKTALNTPDSEIEKFKNSGKITNYINCLKVLLFDDPLVVEYHEKKNQLIDFELFLNANAILKLQKNIHINYPAKIVNIIFDEIDLDKNNKIDIKEFEQFYSQSKKEMFSDITTICSKLNAKGINVNFNSLTREDMEKMITYELIPLNHSQRNQIDTFKNKDEEFEKMNNK